MEPEVRNKLDLAIEIRDVYAREILDFAGNPAIEVEVLAGGETVSYTHLTLPTTERV